MWMLSWLAALLCAFDSALPPAQALSASTLLPHTPSQIWKESLILFANKQTDCFPLRFFSLLAPVSPAFVFMPSSYTQVCTRTCARTQRGSWLGSVFSCADGQQSKSDLLGSSRCFVACPTAARLLRPLVPPPPHSELLPDQVCVCGVCTWAAPAAASVYLLFIVAGVTAIKKRDGARVSNGRSTDKPGLWAKSS